jgi:putative lipoic acid-binding regulatory protein
MILDNSENRKPKIEYPTKWGYKIIGRDVDEMLSAIEESIEGLEYEVTPSNVSRNEKYYSLNLKVLVPSELIRDILFEKLDKHPSVIMVI